MAEYATGSRFWTAHIAAQAKSGLNRAEYYRRHELSYHTLSYWQRKLRQHTLSDAPQLIPIPVASAQPALSSQYGNMRVVLPNNISIELSNTFSSDALARLLPLLASR